MLRHSELTCERNTTLRWSPVHSDAKMPPYDTLATVGWESPSVIWMEAMCGQLPMQYVREWAAWLQGMGITTVKAHRAPGHILPLFRPAGPAGEYMDLDVARFVRRFGAGR